MWCIILNIYIHDRDSLRHGILTTSCSSTVHANPNVRAQSSWIESWSNRSLHGVDTRPRTNLPYDELEKLLLHPTLVDSLLPLKNNFERFLQILMLTMQCWNLCVMSCSSVRGSNHKTLKTRNSRALSRQACRSPDWCILRGGLQATVYLLFVPPSLSNQKSPIYNQNDYVYSWKSSSPHFP